MAHMKYNDATELSRDIEDMNLRSMFILLGAITEENYTSRFDDPKRLVAAEIIQNLYDYTPWDIMEVYPVEGSWICSRLFTDPGGWFKADGMAKSHCEQQARVEEAHADRPDWYFNEDLKKHD